MSDRLYHTLLRWEPGRGGVAKFHGCMTLLTQPPRIGGERVHRMEYLPMGESVIATIQPRAIDSPRDMRPDEVEEALALLRRICTEDPV